MKRIFIVTLVSFLLFSAAFAQAPQEMKLPLDPTVRYGVLENGMTYYIKANKEPENRASFYMIQNVGALLENDEQNGLAHFLEHMAFNGTEHFPGKGILNTLEKNGVAFGRNINAYTAQEETVYNLSEVPTNRPGLLDTCLLVLHDWSNYLLLTEEEIEAERGVLTEEWRTRRTANFRMYKASLPYLFNHSKYSERDVIGDIEVIKNFKYDVLRDFYHNWYRTDLQAIAVVGDFDADEVEKKVINLFSEIPAVEDPMERPLVEIADNDEIIYGLVTDKEADQSSIGIYIRQLNETPGIENAVQLRDSYVEDLFNRMMSQRISELLQKGDPPFVMGNIMRGSFTRNYDATRINVIAKTNEEARALKAILEEVERVKRFGFNPGELERAKSHFLSRMDKRVKQKDKISNDQYAREYRAHYLNDVSYMDIDTEYELMKVLFNTITVDDYSNRLPVWFSEKNNVMVIQGPESDDINHLTRDEALALIDDTKAMEVEPYEDTEISTTLIEEMPISGKVVKESAVDALDAEEWILSNGAKVVYRFADFEKDNILFRAYSPGGASLFDETYVPTMDMLPNLIPFYGVGDYDQVTLQKMLTGKNIELNLSLNELAEGMSGNATPKDFEYMMQLVYLRFMSPRFDQDAHQAIVSRYRAFVENMSKNPQKIVSDSLNLILSDYNARTRVMNAAFIDDIDFEKLENVYNDRFTDISDFTFFFVGNIQEDELRSYVETYIGSIPDIEREETWIDHQINEPEGKVEKEIQMDLSVPKSTAVLVFNNEMKFSPENQLTLELINGILDLRFVESIREEEGGTYGVSSNASLEHYPEEKASLFILFDTDPGKAEYLKGLVYKELEKIVNEGPQQKDLDKSVENLLKEREENRAHNSYWMNSLYTLYRHGYNPDDATNFEDILKSISKKDIQKVMKQLYEGANVVDLIFSPSEKAEES